MKVNTRPKSDRAVLSLLCRSTSIQEYSSSFLPVEEQQSASKKLTQGTFFSQFFSLSSQNFPIFFSVSGQNFFIPFLHKPSRLLLLSKRKKCTSMYNCISTAASFKATAAAIVSILHGNIYRVEQSKLQLLTILAFFYNDQRASAMT